MARPRSEITVATELKLEQIVRMQLLGHTTESIASAMNLSPGTIAELIRHRKYREVKDRIVPQVYADVDKQIAQRKASEILDDLAPTAAIALQELLAARDQKTKIKDPITGELVEVDKLSPMDIRLTATAVLDRAGYGPVQRRAIKQRVELDPVTANIFAQALKEADHGRRIIEGEVVDTE